MGPQSKRLRLAKIRADSRDQRLAPVKARLAALSAGARPARETITWKPEDLVPEPAGTLWITEEESWETHCRQVIAERDAIVSLQGLEAWSRWQIWRRRVRNERLRERRLAGYQRA